MKKEKILISSLVILSILLGSTPLVIAAPAGGQPSGKPFEALREDITQLQNRVAALENKVADLINRVTDLENWKTTIEDWKARIESWKASVIEWQTGIENQIIALGKRITTEIARLDTRIDGVIARITDLETWKAKIEEWKAWVNEKLAEVQEEILSLENRLSNLENPTTLLEKIKLVDGSGSGLDADTVDGMHASELLSLAVGVPTDLIAPSPACCHADPCITPRATCPSDRYLISCYCSSYKTQNSIVAIKGGLGGYCQCYGKDCCAQVICGK